MDLRNLIEVHLDLPRLAKDLDELAHEGRAWAVHQWSRENLATLWEAAKGFRALSLDDFVPPSVPPLVDVIHDGKSSVLALAEFQSFFCRPSAPTPTPAAFGFNRQRLSAWIGPGYFVAHPSTDTGEVDIDYGTVPTEKPAHWPRLAPSSARLGRFVFEGKIDVMRGISTHVSVGRVKKKHGWLDAWLVLLREEPRA